MTRPDLATVADQLRAALAPLLAGHQAAVYPRRDVGRVVVDLDAEAAGALVEALARVVTIPREIDSSALDDSGANR